MHDQTIIVCLQARCAHVLAHRVNFCPYCGAAQRATGAVQDDPVNRLQAAPATATPAPTPTPTPRPASAVTPSEAAAQDARAQQAAVTQAPALAMAPAATLAGARPAPQPGAGASAASRAQAAATAAPSGPPPGRAAPSSLDGRAAASGALHGAPPSAPWRRPPVRLRWWLLALAAVWAIWLLASPSTRRIEAQMDKAIALATRCEARAAQSELIALRATKATPAQLQQVQKALNEASAVCTRQRQRDKAWQEASGAVEAALDAGSLERARSRLRAFTRRWGEDDSTRALGAQIAARGGEHRRADEIDADGAR